MIKKNVISINNEGRKSAKENEVLRIVTDTLNVQVNNKKVSGADLTKKISNNDISAAVTEQEKLVNVIQSTEKENLLSKIKEITDSVKKMFKSENNTKSYKVYTGNVLKSFKTISDTSVSNVNYAPSDPEKSEKISDPLRYLYINKKDNQDREVYKPPNNAPMINTGINLYRDRRSAKYLSDDNIAEISEEGIITVNQKTGALPSFKLITTEDLIQIPIETSDRKMIKPAYNDITFGSDSYYDDTVQEMTLANRTIKYNYRLGLDNIFLGKKVSAENGGFVSSPIYIGKCLYVTLSADCENAEYYILDGDKEIAILPDTQEKITNEKLFFGFMPRFPILTSKGITVKKNGVMTGIDTIEDLRLFLFSKNVKDGKSSYEIVNLYTIDYYPELSSRQYTPTNSEIKIKIIIRKNGDDIPKINKCQINIHEPLEKWPLSSTDDLRLKIGSY